MKILQLSILIILYCSCTQKSGPTIIIMEKHTRTAYTMAFPEKGILSRDKVQYAFVKNVPEKRDSLLKAYFKDKINSKDIETSYDSYVIKFYDNSGEIDENFENDEGYLKKSTIDDHIEQLIGIIIWKRHGNTGQLRPSWKLSVKSHTGVWQDFELLPKNENLN